MFEDSGLSFRGVNETIQNKFKKQKGRFLSMLLGTLGPCLLGNLVTGKRINRAEKGFIRAEISCSHIINMFLLAGDKFMPELHLKQPGFTCSACGLFTKNKGRIQKFNETGDRKCIYKNELHKACFEHDMAYVDFKDLARRTAPVKVLRDKAFNIAKNQKYDGYQ